MQTFTTTLIDLKSSVWKHGFIVPNSIAKEFLSINDKRVLCSINQSKAFHAALMPKGDATWFINVNKEVQKSLHLALGHEMEIKLETDTSEYGMELSEVFIELLAQDEEGKHYFEALTMGKKRTLIHIINTGKSEAVQIQRSINILEYLKDNQGKIDFKTLQVALRQKR